MANHGNFVKRHGFTAKLRPYSKSTHKNNDARLANSAASFFFRNLSEAEQENRERRADFLICKNETENPEVRRLGDRGRNASLVFAFKKSTVANGLSRGGAGEKKNEAAEYKKTAGEKGGGGDKRLPRASPSQ